MGFATVAGGARATKPVTGILASDLAVGSTVKLMENGAAVEYLVVNQGKPSDSSLYDDSCDGVWLLRKECHSQRQWHISDVDKYETSSINTWLNGSFYNFLSSVEQAIIKQVKIPYRKNGGKNGSTQTGANGLSCKIFLLSICEVGWSTTSYPTDGAKLGYFNATNSFDAKRIAYYNGSPSDWWLRSMRTDYNIYPSYVGTSGSTGSELPTNSYGIRPALILPKTALFDKTTMLLKGVS